jgi:hypothetical protein
MASDGGMSTSGLEIKPTETLSRKSVSPSQKRSYIEGLPEEVFRVVLDYSEEKDYRNLVNTNQSFFLSIKAATVKYTLFLPKEWTPKNDSDLSQMIKSVESKGRQISISIKDIQQATFVKFAHLLEGIQHCHFLSPSNGQLAEHTFDEPFIFEIFNNIHHLVLENVCGLETLNLELRNVGSFELINCSFEKIEQLNSSKCLKFLSIITQHDLSLSASLDDIRRIIILSDIFTGIELKLPRRCANFKLHTLVLRLQEDNDAIYEKSFLYEKLEMNAAFILKHETLFPFLQVYPIVHVASLPLRGEIFFPVFSGSEINLFGFSLSLWNNQILSNLRFLSLERCIGLVEFPEMPLVEEMTIRDCHEFGTIPVFPLLLELNIISCDSVKCISYCPLLEKAFFCHCPNITNLSSCAHSTELKIHECNGIVECTAFRNVSLLNLFQMQGVTILEGIQGTIEDVQANVRRSVVLSALPQIQDFSYCRFIYRLGLTSLPTLTSCDGIMYIHDLVIASCNNLTTTKGLKYITGSVSILTCAALTSLADLQNIPEVNIDSCNQLVDFSGLKNHQTLILHGDLCKASFEKFQESHPEINKEIEQTILE